MLRLFRVHDQGGIKMKKRCYPAYSYISSIVLATVCLVFSSLPLFVETTDSIESKIFFFSFMLCFAILQALATIHHMQYYVLEGDYIVVKTLFRTIVSLNVQNIYLEIETLPTFFSGGTCTSHKKWICLYDKDAVYYASGVALFANKFRFKSGCSNSRKKKRLQIIYTDENMKAIEEFIIKSKDTKEIPK